MEDRFDFGEVQQLINEYFNALDRRDYELLVNCLAEDVDWRLRGDRSGRDQVIEALSDRPENFDVRHFVTNLQITGSRAFFILTVLGYFRGDEENAPYVLDGSDRVHGPMIADINITLVRTAEGIKIKQMLSSLIFRK